MSRPDFSEAACLGLENLFTDTERLSEGEFAVAAALCSVCPARTACQAEADRIRPEVGIWAGRRYSNAKEAL